MNWADIVSMILTLVAAIGGTSAIIVGLSRWLSEIITGQIEARTNARYQVALEELKHQHLIEIERLRASVAETEQLKDHATEMLHSTYIAAHSRIADAALALWEKALRIEAFTLDYFSGYQIIDPNNPGELKDERFLKLFPKIEMEDMAQRINELTSGDQNGLPLVGKVVWDHYYGFRNFHIRMAAKTGFERTGKSILLWYEKSPGEDDELLFEPIQGLLTQEQIDAHKREMDGASKLGRQLKVLLATELEKLLMGRVTLYSALRMQADYVDMAAKLKAERARADIVSATVINT